MRFLNMFAHRRSLNELSSLNDHMLNDLGLCRRDIFDASKMGAAKNLLEARRAQRSTGN